MTFCRTSEYSGPGVGGSGGGPVPYTGTTFAVLDVELWRARARHDMLGSREAVGMVLLHAVDAAVAAERSGSRQSLEVGAITLGGTSPRGLREKGWENGRQRPIERR